MTALQIEVTAEEWTKGEAALASWELGGGSVQSYASTFLAGMVSVQRAERIVAYASAWENVRAGALEAPPIALKDFFAQADIGGHLDAATAVSTPATGDVRTAYLAALGALRIISSPGRGWSQVAPAPSSGQGLSFPFAVVAWGLVGVTAVAGATWFGADRESKIADVKKFAIAAEVSQYLKSAELAAAAGQPIPIAPSLVQAVANEEDRWSWIAPMAGVAVGALALGTIYKTLSSPKATPVRVVNPSPLRRRARRRRSPQPARKARRAPKRAAPKARARGRITSTKKTKATKRRRNPAKWDNVSTSTYVRGPYRIRPIAGRWAVIYKRKVVGESATLKGAKAIAGRKPTKALKRNPSKRTAKQRRGMLYERKRNAKKTKKKTTKKNPRKVAVKLRKNAKKKATKKKTNPRAWTPPKGKTPRAVFMRSQKRSGASRKQAIARWNFKQQAKKRRKNPSRKKTTKRRTKKG